MRYFSASETFEIDQLVGICFCYRISFQRISAQKYFSYFLTRWFLLLSIFERALFYCALEDEEFCVKPSEFRMECSWLIMSSGCLQNFLEQLGNFEILEERPMAHLRV